jgi:hypothetical protein
MMITVDVVNWGGGFRPYYKIDVRIQPFFGTTSVCYRMYVRLTTSYSLTSELSTRHLRQHN